MGSGNGDFQDQQARVAFCHRSLLLHILLRCVWLPSVLAATGIAVLIACNHGMYAFYSIHLSGLVWIIGYSVS